jgi:hypothetical protein
MTVEMTVEMAVEMTVEMNRQDSGHVGVYGRDLSYS